MLERFPRPLAALPNRHPPAFRREAILEDIATKSGIARPTASAFGRTFVSFNGGSPRLNAAVKEAIDLHLRRLAGLLLVRGAAGRVGGGGRVCVWSPLAGALLLAFVPLRC
jgi:hypothetical protein